MMIATRNRSHRRGTAAKAAVVYPVTMLLLIGTVVLGIGVFRQRASLLVAGSGRGTLRIGTRSDFRPRSTIRQQHSVRDECGRF